MYSNIQLPADGERIKAYGEVGQIPDAMFKQFVAMFPAEAVPNPHDVAAAVARLVDHKTCASA
ncbi:hypothetical protein GCM10027093_68260 [Paraburkholderia jirisanensis]